MVPILRVHENVCSGIKSFESNKQEPWVLKIVLFNKASDQEYILKELVANHLWEYQILKKSLVQNRKKSANFMFMKNSKFSLN